MTNLSSVTVRLHRQELLLLLEVLIEKPFKDVFELIGSLNHQFHQEFQESQTSDEKKPIQFTPAALQYCLKNLGDLPYNKVSNLVVAIHTAFNDADNSLKHEALHVD